LKIHHALKETSYLTDMSNIADFAAIATTIGNYLLPPCLRQNHFASTIYNDRPGRQDVLPCGETAMPQASQPGKGKSNTMGDRSPKSNQKKNQALAAQKAAGKK